MYKKTENRKSKGVHYLFVGLGLASSEMVRLLGLLKQQKQPVQVDGSGSRFAMKYDFVSVYLQANETRPLSL